MTGRSRSRRDRVRASVASPPSQPRAATGWDQATFRCGQCGAVRTATSEDDYLQTVGAHHDAHVLAARLNPTEREGLASILRVVLAAPELAAELLALIDQQALLAAPDTSPADAQKESDA